MTRSVEIWSHETGRKLLDIPAASAPLLLATGDEVVIGRNVFRVLLRRHILQPVPRMQVLVTDRMEARGGGGGGNTTEPPVWPVEASPAP